MSTQRPSHTKNSGQAAVTRLAWIAEDSAALMLLRLPLLRAVVQRRHKVLALVPGLTPPHRLTLLAHGIESAALPVPRRSIGPFGNPFGLRRARAELVDILREWRANTALLDCHGLQDFVWRSCLHAGVPAIHPVSPAMDLHAASTFAMRSWATLATPETKAFAATANDVRLVSAALSRRSPSFHILSPVALDLTAIEPEPLPPIESGIVFLGLTAGSAEAAVSSYAGAAKMVQTRTSRARFQLAQVGPNQAAAHPATDTSRLERFDLDLTDPPATHAAIKAAHVVVIDKVAATHMAVLTMALAIGRPVLTIDAPYTRDLVDAGVDGWHVAGNDANTWASAIVAILKRPDLLAGMARAARHKAMRRLGYEQAEAVLFGAINLADLRARAA